MHLFTTSHLRSLKVNFTARGIFIGFGLGMLFTAAFLTPSADAAIHRPGTIEYTTAELKANIRKGPRCIWISNRTNEASVRFFAWEYVSEGNAHLEWDKPTPAWVAARVETAFAVISAERGPGLIEGTVCRRFTPAQVPA